MDLRKINIISGERDVGKTKFCELLSEGFKDRRLIVKGVLSPGIYVDRKKVGISVVNIDNYQSIKLAEFSPGWDPDKPIREWKIIKSSIAWGNGVLLESIPCEVLIVDEIGYLELEKNKGWMEIFNVIGSNKFEIAFIVVRSSMVGFALEHWPDAKVIEVRSDSYIAAYADEILSQFERRERI